MTTENQNVNETVENTEEVKQEEVKNEVATTQKNEVAATNKSYITAILEETKQGFLEANQGMDFDFVRMGDWLTVNKKGNFVEKEDEEVSFGDSIDVVIGYGEQRWSLWGADDTPEEGQLIVAEAKQEDAIEALAEYFKLNPDAQERYTYDDIRLRYMASVIPVDSLKPDDFPQIYLLSFSPTDTILFGKWAMRVYQGKYKRVGIPPRTAVNNIVTRLKSVERKSRTNAAQSWLGIDCEPVGVFNPADYGIVTE
ncbi:hypothetical protein [Ornithinibacillus sp. JPR2-1]|uniref:hypothetical protein n=1 Tax=Ornithinibacillus sp. JPR2-1 TaxID=2094019 RepID=UPI0031D29378